MKYIDEIQKGMDLLASYDATFVGQAVAFKGTSLTNQVKAYRADRLVELPVAEEFQMGFCIGLALRKQLVVSMYPRSNFAILACNQIVNHLDKWEAMCKEEIKVIVKIAVGSSFPLDPGEQHKANYAEAFRSMCTSIEVYDLIYSHQIYPAYEKALKCSGSSILIEHADLYKLEL
jgi:pyruvate/2-oxoglutarate/acetoin dehydrogenase E1 component